MVGTFVADTLLVSTFAKSPFGLLVADTTGAAAGPSDDVGHRRHARPGARAPPP